MLLGFWGRGFESFYSLRPWKHKSWVVPFPRLQADVHTARRRRPAGHASFTLEGAGKLLPAKALLSPSDQQAVELAIACSCRRNICYFCMSPRLLFSSFDWPYPIDCNNPTSSVLLSLSSPLSFHRSPRAARLCWTLPQNVSGDYRCADNKPTPTWSPQSLSPTAREGGRGNLSRSWPTEAPFAGSPSIWVGQRDKTRQRRAGRKGQKEHLDGLTQIPAEDLVLCRRVQRDPWGSQRWCRHLQLPAGV